MEAMQEAHSQSPSGQDAAPPFLFRDHFDSLKKEEDETCKFSDSLMRLVQGGGGTTFNDVSSHLIELSVKVKPTKANLRHLTSLTLLRSLQRPKAPLRRLLHRKWILTSY